MCILTVRCERILTEYVWGADPARISTRKSSCYTLGRVDPARNSYLVLKLEGGDPARIIPKEQLLHTGWGRSSKD